MYSAYVDGACRPNPGRGAYAFIIFNDQGQTILQDSGIVSNYCTNNIAEYTAVIKALEAALEYGIKKLTLHSDSELTVRQLNQIYAVNNPELQKLYKKVITLSKNFNEINFVHIPREQNKKADGLANEVFGNGSDTRRKKAEEIAKNVLVKTENGYIYLKEDTCYFIDLQNLQCTCPDKQNRAGICKHIMAAQIVEEKLKTVWTGAYANIS